MGKNKLTEHLQTDVGGKKNKIKTLLNLKFYLQKEKGVFQSEAEIIKYVQINKDWTKITVHTINQTEMMLKVLNDQIIAQIKRKYEGERSSSIRDNKKQYDSNFRYK